MIRRLLHRLGVHHWRFHHGSHNRYYECGICAARRVHVPESGHQPIDHGWLRGEPK